MADEKITLLILEVATELKSAMQMHAPMTSNHEAYAVILEELDELWDEIKLHKSVARTDEMRKEAKQVAAMAIRFMHDLFP